MIAYKPWRRCSIDYSSQSWISLKNIKFPWGHPFRYNRESTKLPSPTIRKSAGYFDLNIMPHSYIYSIYHAKNDFLCHSPHQTNWVKLSQWRILVSFPTSKLFSLRLPPWDSLLLINHLLPQCIFLIGHIDDARDRQ